MANLIVTVIAIALIAVASLMGAYYGGSAFTEGQDEARAAAVVNGAQQVVTAIQLARARATTISNADLADSNLVNEYLTEIPNLPEGWGDATWQMSVDTALTAPNVANANVIFVELDNADADALTASEGYCSIFNKNVGINVAGDGAPEVATADSTDVSGVIGGGTLNYGKVRAACVGLDTAADGADSYAIFFRI